MSSVAKWVVGIVLLAGAAAFAVALYLSGKRDRAQEVLIDGLDASLLQNLQRRRAEIDRLEAGGRATAEALQQARVQLAVSQANLAEKYERLGLSADEVARRFSVPGQQ